MGNLAEQKLCVGQSEIKGSVWKDKLFEMINQEFKPHGRKYQVLPNFRICCKELRRLKVTSFGGGVHSFCSVGQLGIGRGAVSQIFWTILMERIVLHCCDQCQAMLDKMVVSADMLSSC